MVSLRPYPIRPDPDLPLTPNGSLNVIECRRLSPHLEGSRLLDVIGRRPSVLTSKGQVPNRYGNENRRLVVEKQRIKSVIY